MDAIDRTGDAKSIENSDAKQNASGKFFCSSCRKDMPSEGSQSRRMNQGTTRRVCATCIALIASRKKTCSSKAGRKLDPRKDPKDYQMQHDEYEDRQYLREIGF